MEKLETINKRLLETYGRGARELPRYRVVWSTFQTERRHGTFIKETESGIYLGQETCEREVPKYPFWPDYWILECVQHNLSNPELLSDTSYEPLWRFCDKQNVALPYDWEAITMIVYAHNQRGVFKNQAMIDSDEEEKKRKEAEQDLIIIQDNGSAFHGKLASGEAVGYGVKK